MEGHISPPSLHNHLVQLQWVSLVLKKLGAALENDKTPLTVQHPLVSSLLEGLCSPIPSDVTCRCMVLTAACVRHGWLPHQDLLSAMVTQAVVATIYAPVVEAVGTLLQQEMLAIVDSCSVYISPYSLRANVHPFISILNSRPEAGLAVICHVIQILKAHRLSQSSVQLVEPVIKHLFLQPSPPQAFSSLATQLEFDLALLVTSSLEVASHLVDLMVRLLPLRPIGKPGQLLGVVSSLTHLIPTALTTNTRLVLIDFCFHLSVELTLKSLPLLPLVDSLSTLLRKTAADNKEVICQWPHHVVALSWLLFHHLTSPDITTSLLALSTDLCTSFPLTYHLSSLLVLPLVQLLSQPTSSLHLLEHVHSLSANQLAAKSLLQLIQESCHPERRSRFAASPALTVTAGTHGMPMCMALSVRQYLLVHQDPSLAAGWLEAIAQMKACESAQMFDYLAFLVTALATCFAHVPDIVRSVFLAFGGLAKALPSLTPSILPFLLHLHKYIPDPNSKLKLFHSIPTLATHTASAVSVLSVIQFLATDSSLLALATHLIGKAWRQQDQLYPYVKEFLTRPLPSSMLSAEQLKEIEVSRVALTKDICCSRAEQHGEEMLSFISRTLSSAYHDTLLVAMALEGVVSLCLHEVVDVVTVWGVLGKGGKLTSDLRPGVLVALCSLFVLGAELESETIHSHKVFRTTALQFLWKHVFSQNSAVSSAALKALSNFKLEDFLLDHLPKHVYSMLAQHMPHDSDSASPLVGSQCVQLVQCIPLGALTAYSTFLASLVQVELDGLSRGLVHSAVKEAMSVSSHETGLRIKAKSLRERQFSVTELSSGYIKYCALTGLMWSDSPERLTAARKHGFQAALDKKLAVLKDLFGSCTGLMLELGGGRALWEALAVLYSCKRWEAFKGLCQLFYQVRLTAVNSDHQVLRRHHQAHEWALRQALKVLQQFVKDNAACVFMAAVGVASFTCVTADHDKEKSHVDVQGSLLFDLMNGSVVVLCGDCPQHVTYSNDLIEMVTKTGGPQMKQAVVLSLPLLFRSVTGYWGPAFSTSIQDKLLSLLSGLFDDFNGAPNWYTSIVLSQLFVNSVPPCRHLSDLFNGLIPFLEVSTQGASVELLSLTASFIPALLIRGNHQLAINMLSALQQQLTDLRPSVLSSHPVQLCVLHLSSAVRDTFAAGLITEETAMTFVTQLADIATKAPSEAAVQLSLGLTLQGLSAYGHAPAQALAESVGTKWLHELGQPASSTDQVVSVMVGLAGLVGVDPVKGVVWECMSGTSQHSEMMLALAYLVVDSMEKLSSHEEEAVSTLAMWVAVQIATDVTETLAQKEKVPLNYSYLPSSSTLPTIIHTSQALVSQGLSEANVPILTCLLRALTLHTGQLPPTDYSALFLPILRPHGCGSKLQQMCIKCLTKSKNGQGFKHLLLFATLPHVFPCLQKDCQTVLLENLLFSVPFLCSFGSLDVFLCHMTRMICSDLIQYHSLLTSYLRGLGQALGQALARDNVESVVSSSLQSGVSVLYTAVCETVQSMMVDRDRMASDLVKLLGNASIWKEMAQCLTFVSSSEPLVKSASLLSDGRPYVGVTVCCSQVGSAIKPFKSLASSIEWVLNSLPAVAEDIRSESIFLFPFISILQTLGSSCSLQHKDSLLHQTELLHMLSAWTRAKRGCLLSVNQWRAVILFAMTACSPTPSDSLQDIPSHVVTHKQLHFLLTQLHMTCLPNSSIVREKDFFLPSSHVMSTRQAVFGVL